MKTYKDNIKVDDLITSYSSGYFRVTKIERRFYTKEDEKSFDHLEKEYGVRPKVGEEYNPKIYSRKLLTSNLKKRSGKESCDASYCFKLEPELEKKVQKRLEADPSIEENSIKGYNKIDPQQNTPSEVSDDDVLKMRNLLSKCKRGQSVEEILANMCPQLFTGIEVANGFINSGKQFAVYLNNNYAISIIYDETENMVTEFVSGTITKKST